MAGFVLYKNNAPNIGAGPYGLFVGQSLSSGASITPRWVCAGTASTESTTSSSVVLFSYGQLLFLQRSTVLSVAFLPQTLQLIQFSLAVKTNIILRYYLCIVNRCFL